jgi:alpha-L-fucosidase
MKNKILLFALLLQFGLVRPQLSGGGDLNPDLKPPKELQEKWMDLRIGLSVHWGPSSLGGEEISWSRHSKIKKEVYDSYYKQFNPVKFDAKKWVKHMKDWGVKYISPTAKHHDGFCLWYSDYSEYDMENAKHKVDIIEELSRECKANDIMFGCYYSNLDWYHPDWHPYLYGGPGPLFEKKDDSPNLDRYFKFFENQCKELINRYGVDFIQFDGEWDKTYTHEIGSKLYRIFHEAKPNILLSSRIDIGRRAAGHGNHLNMDGLKYAGDYQDRERVVNHGNNVISWLDHPWQAWVTIDKTQWSYNPDPQLMSVDEMIIDLVSVIGNNGNYMINLGPRPDGSFDPVQIEFMDKLGVWIKKHAEAIYGTRGGPFYPFKKGVATKKGKKAWVFVTDKNAKNLTLPALDDQIVSAKVFGTSTKVKFTQDKKSTRFNLTNVKYEGPVRVIELQFNKEVKMAKKIEDANEFVINGAKNVGKEISYTISSKDSKYHYAQNAKQFLKTNNLDYTIHSKKEDNPKVVIDLKKVRNLLGLVIKNREGALGKRAKDIEVFTSNDGKSWQKRWQAKSKQDAWEVPITVKSMGAEVIGDKVRYIKLQLPGKDRILHLKSVAVYCK